MFYELRKTDPPEIPKMAAAGLDYRPINPSEAASSRPTEECCQGDHDHGSKNKQITIFDIVKAG
jgi:hypothetical protein